MALFIMAIIMLVLGIGGIIMGRHYHKKLKTDGLSTMDTDDANIGRGVGFGLGALLIIGALLAGFFSSFTPVSTKNVAIITTFGHPDGERGNGANFILPWQQAHEFNAAIQTDNYLGDTDKTKSDTEQPCIDVRIANQSVACVEVTVRWRIQPDSAPTLFRDYKTFDHVRDSLVTRNLRSALNNAFADYNPLGLLQSGVQPLDVLNGKGAEVAATLTNEIGQYIDLPSQATTGKQQPPAVIIPIVHFDATTQNRINTFQATVADTNIAKQKVLTAEQQAKANEILQKSLQGAQGQAALESRCLDLLEKGITVPGWCFPPGSGTIVQIPAGGK